MDQIAGKTSKKKYPFIIEKLGENEFYFEYPFNAMAIAGSAESMDEAKELCESSLKFTLECLRAEGNELTNVSNAKEITELKKRLTDTQILYSVIV